MLREKIWGKHGYITGTGTRARKLYVSLGAGTGIALLISMPAWFFLLGL